MMSKSKSPLTKGLRVLWLLPLVCLCLGLQARTVYLPMDMDGEDGNYPLFILRQWNEEKEITKAEFDQISQGRIQSIEVLKDDVAKEKYGDKAANGVIVVTMKRPQELDEIVVISYSDDDEPIQFLLAEPDTMPKFQGEDMEAFSRWLNRRILRPKGCKHAGTMKVSFIVDADGSVKDINVYESVCEELDALVVSLISESPNWEPATSNGKPVAQYISIPISFVMR